MSLLDLLVMGVSLAVLISVNIPWLNHEFKRGFETRRVELRRRL